MFYCNICVKDDDVYLLVFQAEKERKKSHDCESDWSLEYHTLSISVK